MLEVHIRVRPGDRTALTKDGKRAEDLYGVVALILKYVCYVLILGPDAARTPRLHNDIASAAAQASTDHRKSRDQH